MRRGGVVGVLAVTIAVGAVAAPAFAAETAMAPAAVRGLEVFSRPPVLVRAGETVRIPVVASCSTDRGTACDATVSFALQELDLPWREFTAAAGPALAFDVSAPAARATSVASAGSVSYVIRVDDALGRSMTLPAGGQRAPLRFYAVRDMASVRLPAPVFGRVAHGVTVLSLPWGTGDLKAGLAPGNESPTLGPSSFDVDAQGRVYLLDTLQRRLATFTGEQLLRSSPVPVGAWADVSVTADGGAYVLTASRGQMTARRIDAAGRVGPSIPLGAGIPSEIRAAGDRAFVRSLPMDAWMSVPPASGGPGAMTMGRPLSDGGQLLKVIDARSLRLATVRDGVATDAVELASSVDLGEVALAEPDGRGGYVAVVRVWRDRPVAADQYQVVHVTRDGQVAAFCVRSHVYAQTAALSVFRLGRDGRLYQLTSGPAGMRVVRYRIGGMARSACCSWPACCWPRS